MSPDAVLTLLTAAGATHTFTWVDGVLFGALLATCAAIAIVDARESIIPDGCNLLVAGLGLAAASLDGAAATLSAATQGAAAFLAFWAFRALYHALRGRHGLGLGDVKFLGGAGIWIGLGELPPLVLAACAAALAWLALMRLRGQAVTAGLALPFGPFLVAGFVGVLALRFA